jgi:hypothetical protein
MSNTQGEKICMYNAEPGSIYLDLYVTAYSNTTKDHANMNRFESDS